MRYLYLDNFRGFQDSLIPVSDVNFCVGENSSGKTSFLSAVNLLSSHRFWFEQSFEGAETAFKHYQDYVSVAASDQSYFRMGVAEEQELSPEDRSARKVAAVRAYLFTYVEKDGMPRLVSCTTNFGERILTIYFSEQAIRYRVTNGVGLSSIKSFDRGVFNRWAAIQEDRSLAGTKKIVDNIVAKGYAPPLYALAIAMREISKLDSKDEKLRQLNVFPEPAFGNEAAWIAPIRTKPRRTYDEVKLEFSPEGTHMPYLIKRILDGGDSSKRFIKFIKKFGRESGLFKDVRVHRFGKSAASPFELEIVLEAKPLNISNVGYGVSQGLPVIVEAFARHSHSLFAIQQPEVHLHPRAQAAIGEMVYELSLRESKRFIIETHSDFMIDRFRVTLRDAGKYVPSQVLFFQRINGRNVVAAIPIDKAGDLSGHQPEKYRDFFMKESLRVIGL
jgi:predicted ATPase